MNRSVTRLTPSGQGRAPLASTSWRRTMVRGLRPNDLSGKAGEIAAELEERLERGEYRFGEALSIYALASQFNASRQPVSTAVLYLRSVGYLEVIPQVGCRVVSPSEQEVADFYLLFAHNEAVIAQLAAERWQAEEADQLLELAREMSVNPLKSRADRAQMADDISIFHDQISAMARSPALVERVSNFRRLFRFYLCQGRDSSTRKARVPSRLNTFRISLATKIRDRNIDELAPVANDYILEALKDWAIVV